MGFGLKVKRSKDPRVGLSLEEKLADTNAISEYANRSRSHVTLWFKQAEPDTLFVSVITLGSGASAYRT